MARRNEPAAPRDCVLCGESFHPMKVDGRYCSRRCIEVGVRERNRKRLLVPRPDSHDCAWAAGFVDGEGCVRPTAGVMYETSAGPKRRLYLRLSVSQKYAPLIKQLRETFGVGRIHFSPARPTSSQAYIWTCNGREALHVVSLIWPWLGEQKKADFKRALFEIRKTREGFVRQPQRGPKIVMEGG